MEHVAQHEKVRQMEEDKKRLEIVRAGREAKGKEKEKEKVKKKKKKVRTLDPVVEAGYSGYVSEFNYHIGDWS